MVGRQVLLVLLVGLDELLQSRVLFDEQFNILQNVLFVKLRVFGVVGRLFIGAFLLDLFAARRLFLKVLVLIFGVIGVALIFLFLVLRLPLLFAFEVVVYFSHQVSEAPHHLLVLFVLVFLPQVGLPLTLTNFIGHLNEIQYKCK